MQAARRSISKIRLLLAGVVGVAMAFTSAHYIFGGNAWNMVPWGVLALAVGATMKSRHEALYAGAIYGYILSFSFLWFDKTGPTTFQMLEQLMVVIGLVSFFGALCGLLLSWLAFSIKTHYAK